VATRSKDRVYGRSLAGMAGSKPAGGMDIFLQVCPVLSRTGLCNGPITYPEKSYRVWCV
jgi:hypothetical protein